MQVVLFKDGGEWRTVFPAPGADLADLVETVVPDGSTWAIADGPPSPNHKWDGAGWAFDIAEAQRRVVEERDRRLLALSDGYTSVERETWPVQVAEANAIIANPDAEAPMLRVLAAVRNTPPADFARHVLVLANALSAKSAAIMAAATALSKETPFPADYADDKWWP